MKFCSFIQKWKSFIYLVCRPLESDNVCCYDKNANLIDSRVKEGGTLQRYHYLGGMGNVPYVTNFYYDILPFLHCCRYFGTSMDNGQRGIATYSECQDYLKFRNVSSCYNYIPPRPGIYLPPIKFDMIYWNVACQLYASTWSPLHHAHNFLFKKLVIDMTPFVCSSRLISK